MTVDAGPRASYNPIMVADILFGVFEFAVDVLTFNWWDGRNPHDRIHPRYGLPRDRVRQMKRTAQGRAELLRIDNHPAELSRSHPGAKRSRRR